MAGRPPYVPDEKTRFRVGIEAACGLPHEQIAERVINPQTKAPITAKTLRKAFAQELAQGTATANAIVAQNLFKFATGKGPQAVNAAKFWLQTKGGWKIAKDEIENGELVVRVHNMLE